ncbi:MAG: cupin [Gammaproteobacteria bacterium 28-57-27]|nr:MAG: cupin [Gammaproteobacteria bacterium 28-57-27]
MSNRSCNFFHPLPDARQGECFDTLLTRQGCRIERIVSHGQASPPGFWYEQDWDEWVLLLAGEAVLEFEDALAGRYWRMSLHVGDYVFIPRGQRHRVDFTLPDGVTIWLAVHIVAD